MIEAIIVCLRIKYHMDVNYILHHDNPVYIKASGIEKYMAAAYGLKPFHIKKMLKKNIEITAINNFGNIIYIKQELDEIIRKESK